MKKYYSIMANLCLLFIENILMTAIIYINPTKENILNISGTIIGILIACEFIVIILVIKDKLNQKIQKHKKKNM